MIDIANEMLKEGKTLLEINNEAGIWKYGIPEYLKDVTKDNCFIVSHWQCCEKPAYQIIYIAFSGRVRLYGCGSWNGYYSDEVELNYMYLKKPFPKEELFIDHRYHL